jgi:hypothetical protein
VSCPRVLPFKNSLMERDFRTRARQDLITLESLQMRRMVRPDDGAGPIVMGCGPPTACPLNDSADNRPAEVL